MDYYSKYQKYKKKYLNFKNKIELEGGGKRKLHKNLSEEEIIITNPIGSPSKMNKFLLAPETDFIFKKCSKKFGKQCSKQNINDILTYIINTELTNSNINDLSESTKLTKEFVSEIVKNHKLFINENMVKE